MNLIGNHLGDIGAKNIAEVLPLCRSLRSVGLRGNMIGIYIYTYIHTYIHTCMHTYIHICKKYRRGAFAFWIQGVLGITRYYYFTTQLLPNNNLELSLCRSLRSVGLTIIFLFLLRFYVRFEAKNAFFF